MFLRNAGGNLDPIACVQLWFGKSHDTDHDIRKRYGELTKQALSGALGDWINTARGCLALMILLDQFPRNLYRYAIHLYDGDNKAMDLVGRHDWLTQLSPEECLFMPCLILAHQENLEVQDACVAYGERLESGLSSQVHLFRAISEEHRKTINICCVFPHRDHCYGREISEAGKLLMEDSTLRFDLPLVAENGSVRFGADSSRLWRASAHSFNVLDRLDAIATQRQNSGQNGDG